jgi:hypothetical protein
MSLADAATALGIAPNSVRSRFKAGKIRGERDNLGKLWVWLDHAVEGSKSMTSNPSIEGSNKPISNLRSKGSNTAQVDALEAHLRTLTDQLNLAQAEVSALRIRASVADHLEGQIVGLETLRDEVRADRDHWRETAERALANLHVEPRVRRSLWARLFGRGDRQGML